MQENFWQFINVHEFWMSDLNFQTKMESTNVHVQTNSYRDQTEKKSVWLFRFQTPEVERRAKLSFSHLPWNMKKVLRRYPFEILCGNWSLPYTGWEKPKKQIFPSAPTEISQFQNMASIKTNKIKKRTPLHNINFWKLTTLLFCPKRFVHSKGPKNAICLWLSHNKEHCRLNMQCPLS